MDMILRPATRLTAREACAFLGVFVLLYLGALAIAEQTVGRAGEESAFQKILRARGAKVDWLVLGASHALPLEYGGIPARLERDTGQSMLVLAEVGAGPLYNAFVFEQARHDLQLSRLLYVVDSFGFTSARWNEERFCDRKLLRRTPLRLSTARLMMGFAYDHAIAPHCVIDYLTGFSKLNPVERFPKEGWRGAVDFDRRQRPSRHAVSARIAYLYPQGAPSPAIVRRYLDLFTDFLANAAAAGIHPLVMKPPVPENFRSALPDEPAFDAALAERLARLAADFEDFSAALDDPALYFDTDHLNRQGVEMFYANHLLPLLAAE